MALALAVTAPIDVAVFGLLVVGVLHVCLEVRFVVGRYAARIPAPALVATNGLLVIAVLARVAGGSARRYEIVVAGLLALVPIAAWPVDRRRRVVWSVLTGAAALAAWHSIETWFVLQAHLHNAVALLVLWEVSRDWSDATRRAARRSALALAAVPIVLLTGIAGSASGSAAARDALPFDRLAASVTPPGLDDWASRCIAAFVFAQLVHYAIWCVVLPRHSPTAVALPARTFWLVAGGLVLLVLLVALYDYGEARTLYSAFGAYHAYLELPLLLALLTTRNNS